MKKLPLDKSEFLASLYKRPDDAEIEEMSRTPKRRHRPEADWDRYEELNRK